MSDERLFFISTGLGGAEAASVETMGSKAYGLLRLARLGLPVPAAFVLGTAVCREYFARGRQWRDTLRGLLATGLARLEELSARRFGSERRPLLVSVRSGAPVSMPGMMDTLCNIGLTEHNLCGLLRATGNPRLVRDCYRRLVRDFMSVVHSATAASFDAMVARHCAAEGVASARELDSVTLSAIDQESLEIALASGHPFPQSPMDQLLAAVEAVFDSWNSPRAFEYRRLMNIDDAIGTAVTVQAMVFGNSGATSGSGVAFTRDPADGADTLYLDFLFNAQGEDLVSGRRSADDAVELARRLPGVAAQLQRIKGVLEADFRDMQDVEFTVENRQLYLLQTRAAKRTPWAALRVAVDMARAGQITATEALERLQGLQLDRIERTRLATEVAAPPLATGISAGIGVAAGSVVFDSRRAVEWAGRGERVILARPDISTADLAGISAADGIVVATGGRTSHAAVVARELGKVCVVGCKSLRIAADGRNGEFAGQRLVEGDALTLDGDTARVYAGQLAVIHERPEQELAELDQLMAQAGVQRPVHRTAAD